MLERLRADPIYYEPFQVANNANSFSPSAGKPAAWNLSVGYRRDSPCRMRPVLDVHDAALLERVEEWL